MTSVNRQFMLSPVVIALYILTHEWLLHPSTLPQWCVLMIPIPGLPGRLLAVLRSWALVLCLMVFWRITCERSWQRLMPVSSVTDVTDAGSSESSVTTSEHHAAHRHAPKFYYAVRGGPSPGIYPSWNEASRCVHGKGVRCQKFRDYESAVAFVSPETPSVPVPKPNESLESDDAEDGGLDWW